MSASPFVWKNSLSLVFRPFETAHLDRLRGFKGFAMMGIALADLKTGRAFGWNPEKVGFAASLTKIAAMYAAFQLQASLRAFPDAGKLKTADLQKRLEADWRPELKKVLGSATAKNDFPQLAKIFTPNDSSFSFNKTFQQKLEGMIGPSSNSSAAYCIGAIGFDYLAGALIFGGFYSLKDGKGLWLSGNYDGRLDSKDGVPAPGVTTIADASQRHQVGTAAAVTLLMVNLGNKKLIDEPASLAMQGLMTNSYAARQLEGSTVIGKLGIQPNNKSFHDCAFVERRCMHYAMTVLFMPNTGTPGSPSLDFALFSKLDAIADEVFAGTRIACERAMTVIKSP